MNQHFVFFRIVLKGPRSSLKRSVVAKVRAALARSGRVGRLRIKPYEKHRERNTLVEGTLASARPLERIVMGLAHGHWLFSLAPDHREATFDVGRTPLGTDSVLVDELLWAHFERYRDSRPYPLTGPISQ